MFFPIIGFLAFCVIYPFRMGIHDAAFTKNLFLLLVYGVYLFGLFAFGKGGGTIVDRVKNGFTMTIVFTLLAIPSVTIFYFIGRMFR